jgi:transposase
MTRPYSADLRERALARSDAGDTDRSIGEALSISPSCLSKWRKLRRETGALNPGKMNGHKKPVLSGAIADWLRDRLEQGAFTIGQLVGELATRGTKTDRRAVWVFVRREGLSFKKNRDPSGAGSP